jgi:hypothetical protein
LTRCTLDQNEAEAYLDLTNYAVGKKFSEAEAFSDFTVTPSDNGAATRLTATLSYSVAWAGGWTISGVFVGWNDVQSAVTLTLYDVTDGAPGTVVRSSTLHTQDVEGFIGIDLLDVGFGVDKGSTTNTMDVQVVRGRTYRVGLKVRCEGKGLANATVIVDYLDGAWGATWDEMKVSVSADLAEELEKLKKRVEALEHHTHTYLTGRGEGHNNTEAETSEPIMVVEDPSDEERRLLPPEKPGAMAPPVKSVFLGNVPNPFGPTTTILYNIPEPLRVTIQLYTAQGRLERTLVDGDHAAGPHALAFDASGLASGVYYYRLTAGRFVETRKLTVLK